jgi:hypothetical protein
MDLSFWLLHQFIPKLVQQPKKMPPQTRIEKLKSKNKKLA